MNQNVLFAFPILFLLLNNVKILPNTFCIKCTLWNAERLLWLIYTLQLTSSRRKHSWTVFITRHLLCMSHEAQQGRVDQTEVFVRGVGSVANAVRYPILWDSFCLSFHSCRLAEQHKQPCKPAEAAAEFRYCSDVIRSKGKKESKCLSCVTYRDRVKFS